MLPAHVVVAPKDYQQAAKKKRTNAHQTKPKNLIKHCVHFIAITF